LLSVPLWVLTPLVVALLLYTELPGWKIFRAILFAPTALSWVVIGIVWHFIFSYHGPINQFLALFKIAGPDWLSNSNTAIAAIIVTAIWANLGTGLIIYLTGLGAISPEIVDAASIDGAGLFTLLIRVVLPLMRRYIAFFATLSVITAFTGLFSLIYVMTGGGPGFGTTTMEYFVYVDAFSNQNFGEASAVGVVLLVVILAISILQMTLLRTESDDWS
jgi:ABC-type sugar transport system permease subunit